MTDAAGAGSSAGGFLEGLLEGGQAGYGFREGIKTNRRRRQLESDLMTLRQQESQRAAAREGREQTVFDEQQTAYNRAEALRKEVAGHIAAPHGHTLGEYLEGRPGTREVGTPPLSADARTAQAVGKTMGDLGGRELTPDQQLLVGTGQVPYGAIAPKSYHPRTRAEWLENLRLAAGIRGGGAAQRLPITMDHAFQVLDKIYTVQDPQTGGWTSRLKPGDRLRIAKKMVAGTVQPTDFPDIEDQPELAPTSGGAAPPAHRNFLQRFGDLFTGGPSGAAPGNPAGSRAPNVQAPDSSSDPARIERARAIVKEYRDQPTDEVEQVLREMGYSDEDIAEIIGSP